MFLRNGENSWVRSDGSDLGPAIALATRPLLREPVKRSNGFARHRKRLAEIDLHGVRLHPLSEAQCISHILEELRAGHGGTVVTPNLDHLRRCVRDLHFGALVAEADVVVADGMPLVWASRLQGTPLPERVAGSNLISSLSAAAAENGRTVFLLGGAEGTAAGAAQVLAQRYPKLKVVGTFCPRIGFDRNPKQIAEIAQRLTEANPDIVFVALGSPKQEHLIAKLRPSLARAWWLGVGVSFSFLTGHVRRAPVWMQRFGIEWLHRLCQEPRRLFKRYFISGVPFAASLFSRAAVRGIPQRFGRSKTPPAIEVTDDGYRRVASANLAASNLHADTAMLAERAVTPRARRNVTLAHPPSSSLSRLKALVLLGGHVRPTPLSTSIDRSLVDLPLDENGSVLNHWLAHAAELGTAAGLNKLLVRVMVDRNSPEPISAAVKYFGNFRVERDQSEYRGTGGVLGDLAAGYEDDDLILVANASQLLVDPLVRLAESLDRKGGDIAVVSHRDGTPTSMMLIACKTLRLIPRTGFIDMKEQAMPLIAQSHAIEVMHCRRPSGLPIRTGADYVQALRAYHMRKAGKTTMPDPLAEDWQPTFGIVEEGAIVDPSARIHDSIVLRGGVVEAGAILVRSIVCPSGLVRKDRCVLDEFVRPVTATNGYDRKRSRHIEKPSVPAASPLHTEDKAA